MKLPSIVRIANPKRFGITPRHYDPIKDEIEQRTSAIRRELQEEGILSSEEDPGFTSGYQSSIRGAFRKKTRAKSSSFFEKSGLLRLLIFVILLGGLGGYLYLGNEVLYYIAYLSIGAAMLILLKRLKGRHKNE
ncbi:MAG TPA: hypothetical protein VKX33_14305 [Cyclobacteriaceae bacterium]|nr:hypothetical protein [Cyclobacteriaceae bacterium]